MTCTVKVEHGAVRLPSGFNLPDGAEVQLIIPDVTAPQSFADRYAAYIGVADDLPPDLAENLDCYLHGQTQK